MPIYEYKCDKCGKVSEILQRKFDVDEAPCEACGAPAHRIMSNTSFVLKGTGWYVTDYKANGGCSASGGNCNGCSGASANGDSKPADGKAADAAPAATPCSSGSCSSCPSAGSSTAASSDAS